MKTPLLLATLLLALCPPAARATTVTFGNFAPGTEIDSSNLNGFAILFGFADDPLQAASVSFFSGAEDIELTSVDLALREFTTSSTLQLAISTTDLPTINSPLLTLSATGGIPLNPADPARVSFVPDSTVTLIANTTYYLQLLCLDGNVSWYEAINSTPVLSNYSIYNFNYGTGSAYTGEDLGAYYITAVTVVPEPSTMALAIVGIAVFAGVAHRVRRRRMTE
jgi:hypothetical protein